MDTAAFFRALYENCEALIEFRPLPGVGEFFPSDLYNHIEHVERYIELQSRKNIYFGIGTRDGSGGTKRNIVEIPAVWSDCDFKDTPPDQLKQNLARFPFRPSAAVHSGGGFHLYWILNEPAGKEDIPQVESVNRRIAAAIGGDLAAVDAARILRVPGTRNHKRQKTVELRHLKDFRYNLDDFMELPEPERQVASPASGGRDMDRKRLVSVFSCRFLRWAYENQADVSEPLWYAVISNIARLSPGGISLCHRFSDKHPKYNREECERKILHALDAAAPHSCIWIKSHGFKKCSGCRGRSPLGVILRRMKG